jgi:glycosyltransferase involved in cell wall biosynthesis
MKKVAIIVQRCHESIVGGSESLAWHYATLLKDTYHVDVLTTTALDISQWLNTLPEGVEMRDGVHIHRFAVTIGRTYPYWGKLYVRLLSEYRPFVQRRRHALDDRRYAKWSNVLQEEFIRHQGPYSEPLLQFLKERWTDYHALIFVTYLYPTSYFGLYQIPPQRCLFAPTLHDEVPAYLSVYKQAARRARSLIWLTDAERRVGQSLWGELPGTVVAMSIDTRLRPPASFPYPYVLYCGRIDPNKGCPELFDFFIKFKREHPSPLRLVLSGKDDIPVPEHPDIIFLGFVSDEEKFSLMRGASLYIMPSPNESFSIVTLEAMAQETPVLVSGACGVLVDHANESRGGRIYHDYESFALSLEELMEDEELRREMGARGREYVVSRYQQERIRQSLITAVELNRNEATRSGESQP